MKNSIYASPLRVYLSLGILGLIGIYSGLNLPISLFPNSSKPQIWVEVPYGSHTMNEFIKKHGTILEPRFQSISTERVDVDRTQSYYYQNDAYWKIDFQWGTPIRSALKEVETIVHAYSNQFPEEVRNQISIYPSNKGQGFFVAIFYSSIRSLEEIYQLLEPLLIPQISQLSEAAPPKLYNPAEKEILIQLYPDRMAAYQLLPKDIVQAVQSSLSTAQGGTTLIGLQQWPIQIPKLFQNITDLKNIFIPTHGKQKFIPLTDLAKVDYALKTMNTWSAKTTGIPCLILFTTPRPGGNIKKMSDDIRQTIQKTLITLPKDIQYKVMVDPSEFIRSAIQNVFHEVGLGALLAVLILFLFIGSFKNTITAAIEIPLSMILAFIPMKLSGMSLNLISLGGLALSAGMNVDASVVVMENIFRHLHATPSTQPSPLASFQSRLALLVQAVQEVKWVVIASTLASLVVFLPLIFTSNLSGSILSDLAKAVCFSHGFSALVALILVPTIRLQLMSREKNEQKHIPSHSPLEKQMVWLENQYVKVLKRCIYSPQLQKKIYCGLVILLILLIIFILPVLPKELMGKPDTDFIHLNIQTQGHAVLKQMEDLTAEIDSQILNQFHDQIKYTYSNNYQPNASMILARLKNKNSMQFMLKKMQTHFTNTPLIQYQINPWNPAELPIPHPPQLKITIRGGTTDHRLQAAHDVHQLLEENQVFPRLSHEPSLQMATHIILKPDLYRLFHLRSHGIQFLPTDFGDLLRVMTTGRKIGEIFIDDQARDIVLRYLTHPHLSVEEIAALPIGVLNKMIPLRALTPVHTEKQIDSVYKENQRELYAIFGEGEVGDSTALNKSRLNRAKDVIEKAIQQQKLQVMTQMNTENSTPHSSEIPTLSFEMRMKKLIKPYIN